MYYFFFRGEKLCNFKKEFEITKESILQGKTPVFSEVRCARTNLIEVIPHYTLQGIFLIFGTIILSQFEINDTLKIAVVLLVNGICSVVSSSIFIFIKHFLRIKMLKKIGVEINERNISVLESLEYQSV